MKPLYEREVSEKITTLIFFLLIAYLLFPLFRLSYIVTHDGPSHIYNAGLIRQLLAENSLAGEFVRLKEFPEPNWIGHCILVTLTSVFSPAISDKIFLAAYIILFPLFFLMLLKKINSHSTAIAFLIFPFVYSIFFYLGVYNFLAGVTLLLPAMFAVLPRMREGGRALYLRVFFFSVLLYFSHLLTLGVFIIIVGLALLFAFLETPRDRRKNFLRHFTGLVIAFLPVVAMTFLFFLQKLELPAKESNVSFGEMLDFLLHVRFLITLTYEPENIYALVIFGLFVILLFIWISKKFSKKEKESEGSTFYKRFPFWLTCTLLMLLCFFFIPDEAASGGVVKFRFLLLFYLFFIVFLSLIDFPRIVKVSVVIIISVWTVLKLNYMYPLMKQLNDDAEKIIQVTKYIEPNSILLPLNYSMNWIHDNLSNYVGTEKNIFVLDNYEANTPHFPLEWKKDRSPLHIMGRFTGQAPLCADIEKFMNHTRHEIDYVMLWHRQELTDSCTLAINDYLDENYAEMYAEGEVVRLYKLR